MNKVLEHHSTNTKAYKIIIAGGGTGGHIFPAIAIANALSKQLINVEILFVGAKGKMEMEKIPQAGYKIIGLDIAGFNRSSLFKNILLPFKILKSFWQVRNIVKKFKPDAAIGVGGYSSFPVLRYCQLKNIKTFIHESNSFAGKSNILLGKKATKIFVANVGMEMFFPANKIVVTGNPIRTSIVNIEITREAAVAFFGLTLQKKIVLIVGGSLGAKSINDVIGQGFEDLIANDIQLIWQTGKTNAQQYHSVVNGNKNIWVNTFIEKMDLAYLAADIIISRSGAMSVAEICVVKKPAIFIPYPLAAEDHQTANAQFLVNKYAALIIKDSDVKQLLIKKIIELKNNNELQHDLIKNITPIAILNADEVIANQIIMTLINT